MNLEAIKRKSKIKPYIFLGTYFKLNDFFALKNSYIFPEQLNFRNLKDDKIIVDVFSEVFELQIIIMFSSTRPIGLTTHY